MITIHRVGKIHRRYLVIADGQTTEYLGPEAIPWRHLLERINYDLDQIDWDHAERDKFWIRGRLADPDYRGPSNQIGRLILKVLQDRQQK
jgi:hypothetical protein